MTPNKAFARVDAHLVYPPLLERLIDLVEALDSLGEEVVALSGFRKMSEQAAIYFQGRTTAGKIVTRAQPGYSSHNYGLGCDLGRFFGSRYSEDAADYVQIGAEAKRLGLVWGGDWHHPDAGHVQWPGFVTGAELQPLKDIYDARSTYVQKTDWLSDVWAYVTKHSPTIPDAPKKEGTT